MARPRTTPPPGPLGRDRSLVVAAIAAAAVVAALVAASLLFRDGEERATTGPTSAAASAALFAGIPQERAVLGSPDAPVTLIQFEDLQCPICGRYQEEGFAGIVNEYVRTGKVKLRFAGLAFIGPDSEKALAAVLAAGAQGKLWQLADALYANQGGENSGWVTDELLERLSGELGIDYARLRADAAGAAVRQQASSMQAEAEQREVQGTPWFFLQVGDLEPYHVEPRSFAVEEFRTILDDALAN